MTARPLPDQTPGDRYGTTVRDALRALYRARQEAAGGDAAEFAGTVAEAELRFLADVRAAADTYAAALIEHHARDEYWPARRTQRRRGAAS